MPAMKATTAKAMTKGGIAEALAAGCELKKSVCAKALDVLASVATQEVKKTGVLRSQDCAGSRPVPSQPRRQARGKSSVRS